MKKLIIVALLIMYSTLLIGQTVTFQAVAVRSSFLNEDLKTWDTIGWSRTNVIITVKSATKIISINNKYEDVFKLISVIEETTGIEQGDKWSMTLYKAVDKDLVGVQVAIKEFNSGITQFGVIYRNLAYCYQCY